MDILKEYKNQALAGFILAGNHWRTAYINDPVFNPLHIAPIRKIVHGNVEIIIKEFDDDQIAGP